MNKRSALAVLILLGITNFSNAQVPSLSPLNGVVPAIMNSAGSSYDNSLSYFRFEWSTGEATLIHALAPGDSSVLVTQGVLQPCTEKSGFITNVLYFEQGDYKIFPNPTTGPFELDLFINSPGEMKIQLINAIGQVLETRSYHYDGCCRIELFDLSRYANGVYVVVADLKTFDIRNDGVQTSRHGGFKVVKVD